MTSGSPDPFDRIPDDVADLIAAHAIGALDPDDAAVAEAHIAASPACRAAYEDALETLAALAVATADAEPPPLLRERILQAARAEAPAAVPAPPAPDEASARPVGRRRRAWLSPPWIIAGLATAVAVVALVAARPNADQNDAVLAVLADPAARSLALDGPEGPIGRVVVDPSGRAVLVARLADAPVGRTYEAWTIGADGRPQPVTTFDAKTTTLVPGQLPRGTIVALTEEPDGGSDQPTTAPFVTATV